MQKILLILSVLLFSYFLSSAQFTKGNILLGGQLSYSSSNNTYSNNIPPNNNYKSTYGYFGIAAGKALSEHTVFGVNFSYSPRTQTNYQNGGPFLLDYSANYFNAGIFYRAYKPLGKDFYFFGEGNIAYQWSNESGKDNEGNKTLNGSANGGMLSVYPGVAYKISKKILLELSIPNIFTVSYLNGKTNSPYTPSETKQFSISSSLSNNPLDALGIGFRLIL